MIPIGVRLSKLTPSVNAPAQTLYGGIVAITAPRAYWPLNETTGTVAYESIAASNGTYTNAPTLGETSPVQGSGEYAVTFDGVDDYIATSFVGPTGSLPRSISAWIYRPTGAPDSANEKIVGYGGDGDGEYYGFVTGGVASVDAFAADVKLDLRMNEANGTSTFSDSSNSNHTMTNSGTPSLQNTQYISGSTAGYFDGNDIITTPDSSDFDLDNDFTIEFYIWMFQVPGATIYPLWIGDPTSGGGGGMYVQVNSSGVLQTYVLNNTLAHSTTLTDETWYHVSVTRSGGNMYVSLDGVVESQAATFSSMGSVKKVEVGAHQGLSASWTDLYMDDVRFTAAARYTANFTPPISGEEKALKLFFGETNYIKYPNILDADQWVHVVATWDGTTHKVYKNGVLQTAASTLGGMGSTTDDNPAYIGKASSPTYSAYQTFEGKLSDVLIWDKALSASEISNMHAAASVGDYVAIVQADSPLLYLRCEDFGSSLFDSSENYRIIENHGANGYSSVSGAVGNAIEFGASSAAYVSYAAWMDITECTLEVWFKANSTNTGYPVFISRAGTVPDETIALYIQNGSDYAFLINTTGAVGGRSLITEPITYDGNWHHVVGVYSASEGQKLYIDGAEAASASHGGGLYTGSSNNLNIGFNNTSGDYITDPIDELAMYGTGLTAAQVLARFNAGP